MGQVVSDNKCDFIIYPFGTQGILVKAILNAKYGIDEKVIIDNRLCSTYKRVENLDYLKNIDLDNCKILITSNNEEIYEELREQLYNVVEKEKCIELFHVPDGIEAKRRRSETIEKMKKEGIAPIYHPKNTNSTFYLPFLPMDSIQRHILLYDDYYDRYSLNYVFKEYKKGIIGNTILEGKGIILDIGANIGNHTLFFCNEYNAQKVYCFEPVERTFSILQENIKLNQLDDRVELYACGLGETESRAAVVDYNLSNIGGTGLRRDVNGNLEIRSLDGLGIKESVVFIKIDVEGMELEVIKGGIELIKRNRPYLMIESVEDGPFPLIREIIETIGYEYERLGDIDWIFSPAQVHI